MSLFLPERRAWGAGDDGSEKKKRKKKKVAGPIAGLRIVDEDATGFRTGPAARMQGHDEDAEDADEGSFPPCSYLIFPEIASTVFWIEDCCACDALQLG